MNTLRSMLRLSKPVLNMTSKRSLSATIQATMPNAASKGKKFTPKNFKEAWLSDVGVSKFTFYTVYIDIYSIHNVYVIIVYHSIQVINVFFFFSVNFLFGLF